MLQDVTFDSTDLDATQAFLGMAYANIRLRPNKDSSTRLRVEQTWVGPINFHDIKFDYTVDYEVDPLGSDSLGNVCICRVHSGVFEEKSYGQPASMQTAGDVSLSSLPDLPYAGRLSQPHYDLTVFDPDILNRVAATAPGRSAQPVRLLGHRPVSRKAAQQLSGVIGYLREHVLSVPEARDSSLLTATFAQYLAASVLNALPNTAMRDPAPTDRRDAKTVLIRRAKSFIDENAHRDIALSDVAEAVHVSPRALQYMFRRCLETTPMAYLRRVRLHHAHRDLVVGDHSETTVTAVAARWGFAHTGRFAITYREAYGCSPHKTLGIETP